MKFLYVLVMTLITLPFFLQCGSNTKLPSEELTSDQRQLVAELNGVTKSYLLKTFGIASFGGKAFCSYKVLDVEREGNNVNEYIYAVCMEYYVKNGQLLQGTGSGNLIALALRKEGDVYSVTSHKVPLEGDGYSKSVAEIFPKKTVDEAIDSQFRYQSWKGELEAEAKSFFGIQSPGK